jgi:hypothetical protein
VLTCWTICSSFFQDCLVQNAVWLAQNIDALCLFSTVVVLFRGAGLLVTAGALLFGLSQRWFPMKHHEEELPRNGEELQDAVPFKKGHQTEDGGA